MDAIYIANYQALKMKKIIDLRLNGDMQCLDNQSANLA